MINIFILIIDNIALYENMLLLIKLSREGVIYLYFVKSMLWLLIIYILINVIL